MSNENRKLRAEECQRFLLERGSDKKFKKNRGTQCKKNVCKDNLKVEAFMAA